MDRRWIDAHRMKGGMPRIQDEATRLRERATLRKLLFMLKASHVVPVAFIQVTDFASDIMVIVQLALVDGLAADWVVCVAAICLSLLVAWGSILKETTEAKKETYLPAGDQLIACLFACGNLHVLFVGTCFISAIFEGRTYEAQKLYELFLSLKLFETGIESVVLGLVTAGALIRTIEGGSGLDLFASSLALSLLSMTYGFFGQAASKYEPEIGHRRPALFLCLLVHVGWGLAAFGSLAAAAGVWWLLGVGALVALAGIRMVFEARADGVDCLSTVSNTLLYTFFGGLPLVLVDYEFVGYSDELPISQRVGFAAARRILLFGVAATSVALAPNAAIAAVLAAFFLADLLCSPHLFRLMGIIQGQWDPLGALLDKCVRPAAKIAAQPNAKIGFVQPSRVPFASGDQLTLLDMLDAIIKQCSSTGGGVAGAAQPDGADELGVEAEALRAKMMADPDVLSRDAVAAAVNVVGEYRPWEEGAQRLLVDELLRRHSTVLAEPSAERPCLTHPLRALPLQAGLTGEVWATKPSFFGRQPTGTNYDLSKDASYVDYFVCRAPPPVGASPSRLLRSRHAHTPFVAGESRVARRPRAQGADAARLPLPRRAARTDNSRGAAARCLPIASRHRRQRVGARFSVLGPELTATCTARPRAALGGAEPRGRHAARVAAMGALSAHDLARQVLHRSVVAGDDHCGNQLVRHLPCRMRQHGRLRQPYLLYASMVGPPLHPPRPLSPSTPATARTWQVRVRARHFLPHAQ